MHVQQDRNDHHDASGLDDDQEVLDDQEVDDRYHQEVDDRDQEEGDDQEAVTFSYSLTMFRRSDLLRAVFIWS